MSLLPLDTTVPRALPTPTPAPASPSPSLSPSRSRFSAAARLTRWALSLLPLLLIGAWAVLDWHAVRDGAARLASADPWWLLAAALFTCLGWVAAACVRQGAIPDRLPPGLLLASQVAAGTANHVLPASIGAHAVTLRFLQGRGIPLARATASLALYSLVKPIAKTLVLLVFMVAFPELLHLGELVPDERTMLLVAGAVALGFGSAALLVTAVRPLRRPALDCVRTALTDVRVLHTRPARILALWGGSAATPLLQGSVIATVGFSLGLPLSWAQVILALLLASTAVGAVPAPGGIGPVDAALVFTMVAFGAPVGIAAATVIGYRVLTVWVPLLPGALVLSILVHRKVL
ncbi:lysylphosphatidylglycerol synthase transmembrane domain-containing protein [Streptomyces sp. IB201691-2A2]|uniref:lysylphosphatidylglycerol synthase transmembrane domain-containing protein n=1 Tax=Streptomyces sp. IB201691-2A2 TaxID=2561920 RepID=UPI00117C871D|nr:lysylphosphatidylglycerol synthase transmembrane domain-containing protein [Streptomyces sp. IB201691-2A2]TRO63153.1 flippase-like domain-containing protein [Streptomyces sp. IB201691-2A2]